MIYPCVSDTDFNILINIQTKNLAKYFTTLEFLHQLFLEPKTTNHSTVWYNGKFKSNTNEPVSDRTPKLKES